MRLLRESTLLLALLPLCASLAQPLLAEDVPGVAEPASAQKAPARTCTPDHWSWNQAMAAVTPGGDLTWKSAPFTFQAGKTVRYIDFEHGSDDHDGASQQQAWKHHPWDPAAEGQAKGCSGEVTYVFKRGTIYRGTLVAKENGSPGNPIRLTSDPAWGKGEAVIAGSEILPSWKQGADRADIPDAGKVWYADCGFKPRCVWMRDGDAITRVELARVPNWKVSDPEEVKSEWWRLEQPNWWENGCGKYKVDFNGHRAWLGVDTQHLTEPADHYVGAIAHVEFGWVMGTPFPTRVEGFDEGRKGIYFQGIWWGDSENIIAGMHYYLEDKPNFLTDPGEFWFDEGKGRLYLRLPGDKDPNSVAVEVARHINLLDSTGMSHVWVSGLSFRFTNNTWDLVQPVWADQLINNACIRVRGAAEDVHVANCRFDHCGKAVRIDSQAYDPEHRGDAAFDQVVISDNDIDQTDHGAIEVKSPGIGDVKVLRNHLHLIGLRNNRQDHCFALYVHGPETMEVAGNLLERTTGSGIFCEGGRDGMRETPLSRNLVHHNKAFETLLSANDWGGIETNGGPFFNYDNISGDPNGFWQGFDPNKPGSARLGMAYYWDHGYAVTGFNLIAYGPSDAWNSKLASQAGLYEAAATIENSLFNSTIYRFWTGSQWSPTGGRHQLLGNVFDDIGGMVIQHGKLKEDTVKGSGAYPHETMAYGKNVFSRVPDKVVKDKDGNTLSAFAVYELNGTPYDSPSAMAGSFASHPALDGSVGTLSADSPLTDPANHDFRPKAGGEAIGHGVKMFVPWTLARNVGEWHFRQNQADPATLQDDHFHLSQYYSGENPYAAPLYPLKGHGITQASYSAGPLEDWNLSAVAFDGASTFASCGQDVIAAPYTYDIGNNQKATASGKDLWSPDVYASSMLIELYLQPAANDGKVEVLVAKRAASGYQLAINKAGGVTFSVQAGDAKCEIASGSVIADGQWHHLVAELDRVAGSARIYTDGVLSAEAKAALPADASLANDADLLVGKGAQGGFYHGKMEFLRICRASLAESKTSIEELYDWEFAGPFLRDFTGKPITGKRDAGALQH